jgi:hypothetical protein
VSAAAPVGLAIVQFCAGTAIVKAGGMILWYLLLVRGVKCR